MRVGKKNPPLGITVCHHSASLVMPNGDTRDRFFYPTLTLIINSYIPPMNVKTDQSNVACQVTLYNYSFRPSTIRSAHRLFQSYRTAGVAVDFPRQQDVIALQRPAIPPDMYLMSTCWMLRSPAAQKTPVTTVATIWKNLVGYYKRNDDGYQKIGCIIAGMLRR